MSLTFEGELGKMVDLRKNIQRDIGLPEPDLIALIYECVLKP
jgi:hypothetical protein